MPNLHQSPPSDLATPARPSDGVDRVGSPQRRRRPIFSRQVNRRPACCRSSAGLLRWPWLSAYGPSVRSCSASEATIGRRLSRKAMAPGGILVQVSELSFSNGLWFEKTRALSSHKARRLGIGASGRSARLLVHNELLCAC